ncbi:MULTISPECIES: phosphatase PAP2 family protein [Gammaproteobacteria]|uniref:phosphatase PAP2 family protein n=1 Tax=Gammaproteobacteria TaxID=1236 RepID=UPI0018695CAA|nr:MULTISPECIES: phosphatase PAP2 family protein [Gammaproteobacteria]
MLSPKAKILFNQLFSIQLFIIWALGTYGSWLIHATEMLTPVFLGFFLWILLIFIGYKDRHVTSYSRFYWLGLLQLVTCWTIFPLFKSIRYGLYQSGFDDILYKLDKTLWFGKSLPEWTIFLQSGWLSELLSFCYFSFYFLIIGCALFFFFSRNKALTKNYFLGLMLMYFFGFIGYFSIPAAGPYISFPSDFVYPVYSGAMTLFLTELVDKGITGMDVFPSLHTGITIYIVGFFYFSGYRRTAYCLSPILMGLILATVYLHYHYGIDVIVGALLAFSVLYITCKNNKVEYGTHL